MQQIQASEFYGGLCLLCVQSSYCHMNVLYTPYRKLQTLNDVCLVASVMSNSRQPYGPWPARLLCPWDSPDKNTGVGCHFLFQGSQEIPGKTGKFGLGVQKEAGQRLSFAKRMYRS